MVKSMTGYGKDVIKLGDTVVTVEIKSVNHRFLDCVPKIPRSLLFLEDKIRKIIQSYFERGRIEVFISLSGEKLMKKTLRIEWEMMDQYVSYMKQMKERYGLTDNISLSFLATNPDCIQVIDEINETGEWEKQLLDGVTRACENLQEMRKKEGQFLIEDIHKYLHMIEKLIHQLEKYRPKVIEAYRLRIKDRIYDFLEGNTPVEEERLAQEIALLTEKGDITEEITRMYSHVDHLQKITKESGAIGRKMDFITQEMLREVNTIGSKSIDHRISEWSIQLKSAIEKIKEQVQNIE